MPRIRQSVAAGMPKRHAHSRVERDKNLAPNGPRAAREIGDANEIELWDCASCVGLPSTFTDDAERRRHRQGRRCFCEGQRRANSPITAAFMCVICYASFPRPLATVRSSSRRTRRIKQRPTSLVRGAQHFLLPVIKLGSGQRIRR
jgi:hypothetical protein